MNENVESFGDKKMATRRPGRLTAHTNSRQHRRQVVLVTERVMLRDKGVPGW
jgi:hypothetical protein